MPTTIFIKDYDTEVTIPEGADMAQVQKALKKQFPSKAIPVATQIEPVATPTTGNVLRRTAAAVAPYTRPALEVGGALAGGAAGAGLGAAAGGIGAIPGGVVGAGLGMAAGRQVQTALEEYAGIKKPATLPQALASTGRGALEGAAMEMSGGIIGKGIAAGLQKVAKAAPRIYESVAKIPPRSVPKATRERAVQTALEYKIPATQKGFQKLRGMIESTNNKIAQVINDAEEFSKFARAKNLKSGLRGEYEEGMLKTGDVLRRLNDVKKWARESFPDPTPINKMIDEFKYNIGKTRGAEISVAQAQKLKQGIYRRLTDAAYGEYTAPAKEMDKAFARGIKEELLDKFPVLQKLNAKDSALISLQNILEKTVNRTRNWDLAGLSEYAGAIGGAEIAGGGGAGIGLVVAKILRSPTVMSRLSFALDRAGKIGGLPTTARAIGYVVSKGAVASAAQGAPAVAGAIDNALVPSASAEELPSTENLSASKRGIEHYTANDWDAAIREWQKALKEEPARAKEIIGWINEAKKEKKNFQEFMQRQKSKRRDLTTAQMPATQ